MRLGEERALVWEHPVVVLNLGDLNSQQEGTDHKIKEARRNAKLEAQPQSTEAQAKHIEKLTPTA